MGQLTVRNIDHRLLVRLKRKAWQEGLPLETYLRTASDGERRDGGLRHVLRPLPMQASWSKQIPRCARGGTHEASALGCVTRFSAVHKTTGFKSVRCIMEEITIRKSRRRNRPALYARSLRRRACQLEEALRRTARRRDSNWRAGLCRPRAFLYRRTSA
jgi:hypothetical protein